MKYNPRSFAANKNACLFSLRYRRIHTPRQVRRTATGLGASAPALPKPGALAPEPTLAGRTRIRRRWGTRQALSSCPDTSNSGQGSGAGVSGQGSVIGCQWSVVSCRISVVAIRLGSGEEFGFGFVFVGVEDREGVAGAVVSE